MSMIDDLIESKIMSFLTIWLAFAFGSEKIEDVKADPYWPWPYG